MYVCYWRGYPFVRSFVSYGWGDYPNTNSTWMVPKAPGDWDC